MNRTPFNPLDAKQQWERFKKDWENKAGPLSFETEALLRHGFFEGFSAAQTPFYKAGDFDRRAQMQAAMGIFQEEEPA